MTLFTLLGRFDGMAELRFTLFGTCTEGTNRESNKAKKLVTGAQLFERA